MIHIEKEIYMSIAETKGSFKLTGKTNIEKAETKDMGWIKKTNLSVKTLKDNFVNTLFEVKNGKGMDIKIKAAGDEESRKVGFDGAIDELKSTFTNDDMVFVMGVTNYDTYSKKFVLKPTGVYASKSDYDAEDFEETNFVEQELIFDSFNGKIAKLFLSTYFGEIVEVEMRVDEELVEDFKDFKTGDLLKVVFSVINKPIYVDAVDGEAKSGGYTPKGKGVSKSNGGNKKKIDGYETYDLIVGIANVESGKYTRKDIRDAQEEYERKQAEYLAKKEDIPATQDDSEDDLPY